MSDQDQTPEEVFPPEPQVGVRRTARPLRVNPRSPEFLFCCLFLEPDIRANSKMEYRFHEQLQRVLGSSRLSSANEITYDVEELNDDEESRDGDEDLQVLGQAVHREVGKLASRTALFFSFVFFSKINAGLMGTGTRSIPWTDSETLFLINTWGEDTLQQELRMTHRTGHIFTIISNKMAAQGFSRTPEQCQTRLKRLKLNFRQSYHNKCVCGGRRRWSRRDAGASLLLLLPSSLKELEQVYCKFYNELGRVLVKDFVPAQQADDLSGDPEEDVPSFVPPDMGKFPPRVWLHFLSF